MYATLAMMYDYIRDNISYYCLLKFGQVFSSIKWIEGSKRFGRLLRLLLE